jgi:mevalonate kinase
LATGDINLLASILNFNHTVLSSLGVSTNKLNALVEDTLKAGCLGAKMTGGGGGGCIIALPRSGETHNVLEKISKNAGEAWQVRIPMTGVSVRREKE